MLSSCHNSGQIPRPSPPLRQETLMLQLCTNGNEGLARYTLPICFLFGAVPVFGDEKQPAPATNTWVKMDKARIGPRGDPALVYDPEGKRFLVLGGGISW